jgi:hypothetical protein
VKIGTHKKGDDNMGGLRKIEMQNKKKQLEIANNPVNIYLNDKTGKFKYPDKIKKYMLQMPDPILDDLRQIYAFMHKSMLQHQNIVRAHNQISDNNIYEKNKFGNLMSLEELHTNIMADRININKNLAEIRTLLFEKLAVKCDDAVFTLQMFEDTITKVENEFTKIGYDLFPKDFNVI